MVNIVIDTNVIFVGLYSNRGSSFKLLSNIEHENFTIALSVPLLLEYEDVLVRNLNKLNLNRGDFDIFLDYLCKIADKREIFYLWRPYLKDPKDDMILELAVESDSNYIITFNEKHFAGIEKFKIRAINPGKFLNIMGII